MGGGGRMDTFNIFTSMKEMDVTRRGSRLGGTSAKNQGDNGWESDEQGRETSQVQEARNATSLGGEGRDRVVWVEPSSRKVRR